MLKKYFSFALTLVIIAFSVCAVHAEETLNINELRQCGRIFAYSGASSAYFYGYNKTTLYSAKVIPDGITRYVSIDGTIRSACHDDNNAYALFESSRRDYSVIKMNMNSGDYNIYRLGTLEGIDNVSFAATENEFFLIDNNGVYPAALSFGYDGKRKYSLSFNLGVERLFTNGGNAYAKAYSGEVYKLSNGKKSYCASFGEYTDFENAGAGFIYTEIGQLISLENGSAQNFDDKYVVKTQDRVFRDNDGILFAAAGNKSAILNSDYTCTVKDNSFQSPHSDGNGGNSGGSGGQISMSDDVVVGIDAGTTVAQLKKSFSEIKAVYNLNGGEVSSGKLRTGFSVKTSANIYTIAVRGDINSTGTVNSSDISELMQYFTDSLSLSGCYIKAADYNFDGSVDNADLVLMARSTE